MQEKCFAEIVPIASLERRESRPVGLAKREFTVPESFFEPLPDELTPEELGMYRHTAMLCEQQLRLRSAERRERALMLARRAASMLREQFGARRIVVFGSLVHEGCFTPWLSLPSGSD